MAIQLKTVNFSTPVNIPLLIWSGAEHSYKLGLNHSQKVMETPEAAGTDPPGPPQAAEWALNASRPGECGEKTWEIVYQDGRTGGWWCDSD